MKTKVFEVEKRIKRLISLPGKQIRERSHVQMEGMLAQNIHQLQTIHLFHSRTLLYRLPRLLFIFRFHHALYFFGLFHHKIVKV